VVLWVFFLALIRPQTVSFLEMITDQEVASISDAWVFATVAVLSAFPTTLAVLTGFLADYRSGRLGLLLASGVKKGQLVWGYIIGATLVAFMISGGLVVIGQVWALAFGQPTMTVQLALSVTGSVLAAAFFFAVLNATVLSFTVSHSAFGAYCFLGGTIVGILTLSYTLNHGSGLYQITGVLPFAQLAALVRQPLITPGMASIDEKITPEILNLLGTQIHIINGGTWPIWMILAFLAAWTGFALILCQMRVRHLLRDR
jgi:hypothetical protein